VGRLGVKARLRLFLVNGHDRLEATALLGVLTIPFVREKTFDGHEQERAKFSLLARGGFQVTLLQQARKEFLGQVLSVVRTVPCRRTNA